MKIEKVICSKGRTGFYFDDQKAIKAGAKNDGAAYIGEPMTPGFTSIRMAGEAISVQPVSYTHLIDAKLDVCYLDEHHIRIGDARIYCTGPRIHLRNTGDIQLFAMAPDFVYDPVRRGYMPVSYTHLSFPADAGCVPSQCCCCW